MKNIFSCFIVLFFGIYTSYSQNDKKTIFVSQLMAKMTLDEKIGQLNLPTSGDIVTGQANSSNVSKSIEEGKVGGLFNIKSVQKIKEIQRVSFDCD